MACGTGTYHLHSHRPTVYHLHAHRPTVYHLHAHRPTVHHLHAHRPTVYLQCTRKIPFIPFVQQGITYMYKEPQSQCKNTDIFTRNFKLMCSYVSFLMDRLTVNVLYACMLSTYNIKFPFRLRSTCTWVVH